MEVIQREGSALNSRLSIPSLLPSHTRHVSPPHSETKLPLPNGSYSSQNSPNSYVFLLLPIRYVLIQIFIAMEMRNNDLYGSAPFNVFSPKQDAGCLNPCTGSETSLSGLRCREARAPSIMLTGMAEIFFFLPFVRGRLFEKLLHKNILPYLVKNWKT